MGFPKSVIGFGVLATAASANAAFLGITGTNYLVVDGGNRYSVMDVYADFTGAFDKCVNLFGQTGTNAFCRTTRNGVQNAGDAATATNGAAWVHSDGSGWMPSNAANANAWDSFVSMGARSQSAAITNQAIGGDVYFANAGTAGASTIQGGYNATPAYVGAGWQTNLPNDPADLAGSYADKRLLLGRFTVNVTGYTNADTLSMQIKGKLTLKVNGTIAGGGTTSQPAFNTNLVYNTFVVPAPGALALVGLAGLVGRRRQA
ncbi:MAG: hypothetical protein K8R92_05095 [Planctomycetes bacterium]|nr:hypothetical protein [Planctomycetota bacterium]